MILEAFSVKSQLVMENKLVICLILEKLKNTLFFFIKQILMLESFHLKFLQLHDMQQSPEQPTV